MYESERDRKRDLAKETRCVQLGLFHGALIVIRISFDSGMLVPVFYFHFFLRWFYANVAFFLLRLCVAWLCFQHTLSQCMYLQVSVARCFAVIHEIRRKIWNNMDFLWVQVCYIQYVQMPIDFSLSIAHIQSSSHSFLLLHILYFNSILLLYFDILKRLALMMIVNRSMHTFSTSYCLALVYSVYYQTTRY